MIKKMYWISLAYIAIGLALGLLNHEIAYWTHFTGESVLAEVHPHAIMLGGFVFLSMPLFMKNFDIEKQRSFRIFLWVYNMGLLMTLGFMTARGMSQTLAMPLPSFADHMVGGLAGIGHIILTIGLGFFFHALFKPINDRSSE